MRSTTNSELILRAPLKLQSQGIPNFQIRCLLAVNEEFVKFGITQNFGFLEVPLNELIVVQCIPKVSA